ncbi:MAG: dinitrogenase iron-molybdenum cofactor biosynthesis protein [Thermoplasmata archaeon]|nr:MAG: dinitrogenase iron-molybdenum cofactor biosynthesis protein [Thermoplasmata archaeon]
MKVCIPTASDGGLEDEISEHFGRASTFTIVDLDSGETKVIRNESVHMGGKIYPPEIMAREKVDAMICKGIGVKALFRFSELGIDVYIAEGGKVREILESFKRGDLKKADTGDTCPGHRGY